MVPAPNPAPVDAPRNVTGRAEERSGPFGLDEAETELLARVCAEVAEPLGIDGAGLVDGLRRGRTLGAALRLPASLAEALYARAHTWFSAGRHERAEDLFRALCVLDGGGGDYWVGYGVCLRLRGASREAGLAFATAAALRPDWAVAHFHAAGLAMAMENWELGTEHLRAFERCDGPDTPPDMRQEAARLQLAAAQHAARGRSSPGVGVPR